MPGKEKNNDRDLWDVDAASVVRPTKRSSRVVFSVQFSREEFDEVVRRAREAGMKPGAFIRSRAIGKSPDERPRTVVTSGVPDGNVQFAYFSTGAGTMSEPTIAAEPSSEQRRPPA